ncbi:AAA family ATPase [Halovenus sp. HT40]|uniref:AAA family ATPase n=1 Tax=Halovenus sp. HT40 TaxID=3126691 RepID=UPI00300F048D
MHLNSVTLKNFKPFHQENPIRFEDERGVTLFGAKNDRGKTAFLEAIKFCLYDFTSDDEGSREQKRDQCINRKAVTEDDGETFVSLNFDHNGGEYTIKRVLEFSEVDNQTAREAENHYVTVEVDYNDEPYIDTREEDNITDYREFRDGILPENASQFFIFDGEQIDEYAQQFGKRDTDVREAIELVLGIEELRKAIDDLQEHGIDHYRELFQEAQSDAEDYREKKNQVDAAREELESLESRYEKKEEKLESKREEKSEEEERLADAGEVEEKYKKLIETRVELYGPEEVEKAEEYLDKDRIDELTPCLLQQLANKRKERQEIYRYFGPIAGAVAAEKIGSTVALDSPGGLVEVLRQTLDERPEDCYVCDQSLEGISRDELVDRLDEATNESTEEARYIDQLAEGLRGETEGDEYDSGHQKAQFQYLTQEISDLAQDISKRERRIERLEDIIENAEFGKDEVDEIRDRLNELKRQEGRLEAELESLEEEIDDQEDLVEELERELDGMEGASDEEERYSELIEVSEQAQAAFKDAKDEYVEKRRESVQAKASDLFRNMTNKNDIYEGLSIHTDYQLRIKTNEGVFTIADQDPSRGARQIIAYAFIAGLAQFSSRDAPILIDTPIARLDPGHKASLIENLPDFVDQVIVFYQPNELTEDDIDLLREDDEIAGHYDIIQADDAAVSTIVDHDPSNFQRTVTADD